MRYLLFILTALCGAACMARTNNELASIETRPQNMFIEQSTSQPNYETIKSFIQDNDLITIEEFIEALSVWNEGKLLLERSALVFAGTGDQNSRRIFPRVILYSPDASFILSYATEPISDEPETLQIIEFDFSSEAFKFQQIKFPAQDGPDASTSVVFDLGETDTEDSPEYCQTCHTPDPRPIWDVDPIWPGVYGGMDDHIAAGSIEFEAFSDLVAFAGSNVRFRFLGPLQKWFAKDLLENPEDIHWHSADQKPVNKSFEALVAKLNTRRLSRLIRLSPHHEQYRDAFLSALAGCHAGEFRADLIPQGETFLSEFPEILDDTKTVMNEYFSGKIETLDGFGVYFSTMEPSTQSKLSRLPADAIIHRTAILRYLLENRTNDSISMDGWSLSLNQSYTFLMGVDQKDDLAGYYFTAAFANDLRFKDLVTNLTQKNGSQLESVVHAFNEYLATDRINFCKRLE